MSAGVVDWSGLRGLGKGLASGLEESRVQSMAELMGAKIQTGDYAGAAKTAFDAGDLQTGLSLVKLGDDKAGTANFQSMLGQAGGIAGLLGGGSGTPAPVQPVAPVQAVAPKISGSAETKAQSIVSGLIKRGIDPKVASAAAGNFLIESSFDNTNGTGDNGTAFGLGQWRNERFAALKKTAGERGWQDLEAQLDHTAAELKGSHRGAYDAALAAPDASSAALAFMNKFEIPSRKAAAESGPRRAAAAARFHSQFGGGSTPVPAAVAGGNPSPQRVQVASADPSFVPQDPSPAAGASPTPAPAPMSIPDDPVPTEQRVQVAQAAPQSFQQAGLNPQAAAQLQATPPGSRARVEMIVKLMSHPKAPEGFKDAMKAALANEFAIDKENRSMTSEQKEYNWDVANGFKGDPMAWRSAKASATRVEKDPAEKVRVARRDWQALGLPNPDDTANAGFWKDFSSRALGGGALVNVDTRAEGAESTGLAAARIADSGKYQEAGQAAAARLPDIATLRALGRNLGVQGAEATIKEGLAPYAQAFGVKLDGVGDIQAYSSLVAKMTPNMRPPGSGATSDFEQKMYGKAVPGLLMLPEGRELVMDMMEAQAQGEVARGDIAARYRNGEIDKGQYARELRAVPNPLDMFKKFRDANPTVVDEAIKNGGKPGRPLPKDQRDASVQLKPAPADEIANARAAIAAGVPQAKVLEKMRGRGFDPSSL